MHIRIFHTAFLISVILVLSIYSNTFPSQKSENPTEIFIIGTVHESTSNFDSDTLLNIFNKIKPDLILVECDSSYLTRDFRLKDDIKYSFPETRAITDYLNGNIVDLRPYDITGRDSILNDRRRRRNQYNFFKDIRELSGTGMLGTEAINILNKILAMMSTADLMANSSSSYINSPEGSVNIDTINYYTYTGFANLIKASSALSQYESYRESENLYWEKRNNVMLENILTFKKSYEGRKIIVLCGFAHKNILKNGLALRSAEENISVKEYWE